MGFGFPWIDSRMDSLRPAEMREFVTDGWRMVVPARVAAAYPGRYRPRGDAHRPGPRRSTVVPAVMGATAKPVIAEMPIP